MFAQDAQRIVAHHVIQAVRRLVQQEQRGSVRQRQQAAARGGSGPSTACGTSVWDRSRYLALNWRAYSASQDG